MKFDELIKTQRQLPFPSRWLLVRIKRVIGAVTTSISIFVTTPALAQNCQPAEAASEWRINVGAAIASSSRYLGSNYSKASLLPIIDARYKDYLFISPIRGISVGFPLAQGLSASAAIGFDLTSRQEKESTRLVGLGNVKSAGALLLGLTTSWAMHLRKQV